MPYKIFTFLIALACIVSTSTFSIDIPKTLWVYWDSQIETAPLIVQICLEKMRSSCEEESWTLVVLNSTNLPNYITNYETQLMQIKKRSTHPQWKATFADLVRLNVLEEHGGVWIDISSVLFKGLSWFHKLDEIPYLLTNLEIQKGEQPDVILPYITYHQNSAETRDPHGQISNWLPGYEVWFMAAKKNATFMHKWRKMYEKHYQLTERQNTQEQLQKNYYLVSTGGDYLNCQKSAYQIIQEQQARLDSSLSFFGERKNANKEFKIAGFHGEFGPSLLFQGLTQRSTDFLDMTVEQIEQKYYLSINFFLKLTSMDRPHYEEKVWRIKLLSEKFSQTQPEEVFNEFIASKPSQEDCKLVTLIVEGSVFGQLVKNSRIALKNGVFTITTNQRQQWKAYCKRAWNISQDQVKVYGRFQTIIEWIDDNACLKDWISLWLIQKFKESLRYISEEIIFPPMRSDGQTGFPEENYYWKQVYSNLKSVTSPPQDHQKIIDKPDLTSQELLPFSGHSQSQLFWLKLKMQVFARRIIITQYLLVCLIVLGAFTLFGLLNICLLVVFRLIRIVFKHCKRSIVYLQKSRDLFRTENPINIFGTLFKNLYKTFHQVYGSLTLNACAKCIRYAFFSIFRFIFGLSFLASISFIIYHYHLIMKGNIYGQQFTLLSALGIQISLNYIGNKIGQNKWILPGLSFQFLYWMSLPVYLFYFGSSILTMTRIIEHKNFQLAYFMCLCIPLILKLIEIQSQNLFAKFNLNHKKSVNQPNKHLSDFVSLLSHLSGWIERVILVFLIMVNALPNLRYMRFSEEYILQSLFQNLVTLKFIGFGLLLCISAYKSFYIVYSFLKCVSNIARIESSKDTVLKSSFHKILDTQISVISPSENSLSSKIPIQQKTASFIDFAIHTIGSYTMIEKYIFRAYLIYVLLFDKRLEQLFKHLSLMSIQESYNDEDHMPGYLMGLLVMIFLNFAVEIYLEKEFDQQVKESVKSLGCSFMKSQQSTQQSFNGQFDDLRKSDQDNEQRMFKARNSLNFTKIETFLAIFQMAMLMAPRLSAINKFYQYFTLVDEGKLPDMQAFQSQLIFMAAIMLATVMCSYVVIRPLINKWVASVSGNGYGSLANDDGSFGSDENDEGEINTLSE